VRMKGIDVAHLLTAFQNGRHRGQLGPHSTACTPGWLLRHDVEREERDVQVTESAYKLLVSGGGPDADVDLVDALEGSRGEAGVQDFGVGAGERLGDARKRFR
jgi:hypothetical protein